MKAPETVYRFGGFELQPHERRLLRNGTPVSLPGKAFNLLICLVTQAPRLVRKEDLYAAVWPDTIVEETNLNYTVSIVRKALTGGRGDERWIETVPRQGYRFVANVEQVTEAPATPPVSAVTDASRVPLVQRESAIDTLETALRRALDGRRQLVFVTGEAGIGKTSVIERFLSEGGSLGHARVARGQCVEHRGEAEAYMPVLEAFGRLGRQPDSAMLVDILDRFAPSWLVQLPGLAGREHMEALRQRLVGQTRERMLRELDEALVALTAHTPLLLVLEDLHWSDVSTIDLLARVARGDDPARLLVIGTYRSADALAASHPLHALVTELRLRGACREIALTPLSRASVAVYLDERFGGAVPASAIDLIHGRTEGSPLFIAALIESWRATGILAESGGQWSWRSDTENPVIGVPESLHAFIEDQVLRLPRDEREALEAAAIVGAEFSAAIIASALGRPLDEVEAGCSRLARIGQFVRRAGAIEYPDGTASECFDFVHAFYMEVLTSLLPTGRRVRLHQEVGLAIEALYGDRSPEAAARLAAHFFEARDASRAVKYLQLVAGQSLARSAPVEAITHLERAEAMLPRLADNDQRREQELAIQSMLATALTATRGFSDAGAEAAYRRAYELAKSMATPRLFPIAFGLATTLELRGDYRGSQAIMEAHLPSQEASGGYLAEARDLLACSAYHQGAFDAALQHARQGIECSVGASPLGGCFGEDPTVGCYTWAALSLWFLGHPDQALDYGRRAIALAEAPAHLYSLANARAQLAIVHQLRREPADSQRWAALTIGLGEKQGFLHRVAIGHVLHGWALGAQGAVGEGLAELELGLTEAKQIGMELDRPYFLALLAETLATAGHVDQALAAIDEGQEQAARSRSFFYEAELWRIRGNLLLTAHGSQRAREADECFLRARETAMRQRARMLLLRCELTRARHREDVPASEETVGVLGSLYKSFAEGFGTIDLLETASFLSGSSAACGERT